MRPQRSAPGRGRGKSARNLALIDAAAKVLAEIKPATIRAVCYRLFTMGLLAAMTKGEGTTRDTRS